jgi:hypothetical protein
MYGIAWSLTSEDPNLGDNRTGRRVSGSEYHAKSPKACIAEFARLQSLDLIFLPECAEVSAVSPLGMGLMKG